MSFPSVSLATVLYTKSPFEKRSFTSASVSFKSAWLLCLSVPTHRVLFVLLF